jgi:hypothetical protein
MVMILTQTRRLVGAKWHDHLRSAKTRDWSGAPPEKSLLKRPHLRLVGAGGCGEHGEIVAGQDQGHAFVNVEL